MYRTLSEFPSCLHEKRAVAQRVFSVLKYEVYENAKQKEVSALQNLSTLWCQTLL
jgi:hypothetical protein